MQSNAVMYYFLSVQRDSANQYKYSEVSWLMLEKRRGTEPKCFKILHWEIEQSLWWSDGFSWNLMRDKVNLQPATLLRALQQRACSQVGAFHQKQSK